MRECVRDVNHWVRLISLYYVILKGIGGVLDYFVAKFKTLKAAECYKSSALPLLH